MDMKEASAMTEASGLTTSRTARADVRCAPATAPVAFAGCRDPLGRAAAQGDHEGPVAVALRRVPARHLGRAPALGDPRACTIMARKLKTFQTSLGFYDLAIAAPSMKAALEAWGAGSNLFHQGVAEETDDPDVVAATMSKPGVVLKRPAGSNGRFAEHSDLPSDLDPARRDRAGKPSPEAGEASRLPRSANGTPARPPPSSRRSRNAARPSAGGRAARERDRERREKATAEAQAALDKAEREHAKRAADIQAESRRFEKRSRAEGDRWEKERERLQAAVRGARA